MTQTTATSRRALLGGLTAIGVAAAVAPRTASAGPTAITYSGPSIPLWPGNAPGSPAQLPTRKVTQKSTNPDFDDRWITGVAHPSLEVRRPAYQDGSAVILMPGGGYGFLAWDNEGEEQARWLTERGVTCFILSYRLPDEGWANRAHRSAAGCPARHASGAPACSRLRRSIPSGSACWDFLPAGIWLAALPPGLTRNVYQPVDAADALSARPDLAGLIYPVISLAAPYLARRIAR